MGLFIELIAHQRLLVTFHVDVNSVKMPLYKEISNPICNLSVKVFCLHSPAIIFKGRKL